LALASELTTDLVGPQKRYPSVRLQPPCGILIGHASSCKAILSFLTAPAP
jgi:hypothetical protein